MKTKNSALKNLQRGFSLVELLVVIAVIAIIAAIAIPNIANITNQAGAAKSKRNAQNIASVASAAKAAGAPDELWDETTVIGLLQAGVVGLDGKMKFGISPLSPTEATAAQGYLESNIANHDGAVLYVPGS